MNAVTRFVKTRLEELADPEKAPRMQRYMKTDMPFHGVQARPRHELAREVKKRFPVMERPEYELVVAELWALPHREEKYLAIAVARKYPEFITMDSLPLYERMIREGAWWDLVDELAADLVGKIVLHEPEPAWPVMDRWIDDDELWIRRAAILCQLRHKQHTDAARLFRYCRERAWEKDFFIRKAIGWALRQYSYTDPEAVKEFLLAMKDELSPLSFKEGAKILVKRGSMA